MSLWLVHVGCADFMALAYLEAACNPNPREPPVTTATFPSREKMVEKLVNWTWSVADMVCLSGVR